MTNEFCSGSSTVAAARVFRPKEKGRESRDSRPSRLCSGGAEGIRTLDLLNAIQTRSQLRHSPKLEKSSMNLFDMQANIILVWQTIPRGHASTSRSPVKHDQSNPRNRFAVPSRLHRTWAANGGSNQARGIPGNQRVKQIGILEGGRDAHPFCWLEIQV